MKSVLIHHGNFQKIGFDVLRVDQHIPRFRNKHTGDL